MSHSTDGIIKFRGKYGDIKRFLKEEIVKIVTTFGPTKKPGVAPTIVTDEGHYFKITSRRKYRERFNLLRVGNLGIFIKEPIEIEIYESDDDRVVVSFNVELINIIINDNFNGLLKFSNKYNIDIKIVSFEIETDSDYIVEIMNGKIKEECKDYEDYEWESPYSGETKPF